MLPAPLIGRPWGGDVQPCRGPFPAAPRRPRPVSYGSFILAGGSGLEWEQPIPAIMKAFYSDTFPFPLPPGHRFPMEKYARLRQRVVAKGLIPSAELFVPDPAKDEDLRLVHTAEYVYRATRGHLTEWETRRIGFPWSPELVERSRRSVGGTIAACRTAIREGIAANLAGGTHHAHPDFGAGFCLFNDVAVAARATQREKLAKRIMILDCDVHQGDGTAVIFRGDESVYTFSLHGEKNFPFHKARGDQDITLPEGAADDRYLEALERGLDQAFEEFHPALVVYLAGADPYRKDHFGRMALTKRGLAERDRRVLSRCKGRGLPVALCMAGGYAPDIEDIVDIHFQTLQLATEYTPKSLDSNDSGRGR